MHTTLDRDNALPSSDQLGRAVGLPDAFMSDGEGGGVIQGSASEGILVALLAARTKTLKHLRRNSPAGVSDSQLLAKMTLYASDQVGWVASIWMNVRSVKYSM